MNEVWEGSCLDLVTKLDDGSVNCIITDPPYGIAYRSNNARRGISNDRHNRRIGGDASADGALILFIEMMTAMVPKLANEAEMYVFTSWNVYPQWATSLSQLSGWDHKMSLIWEKGYPGLGDLDGNWGCGYEMILYLKKGHRRMPYRRQGVLAVPRIGGGKNIHPTEKPVALLEILTTMSTSAGELVVDPFAGSGSTIWAAQRTGRLGIGMEIDPKYVTVANERLGQLDIGLEY